MLLLGKQNVRLTNDEKAKAYNEIVPIVQNFRRKHMPDDQKVEDTFLMLEQQLGYFIVRFPAKDNDVSGFHIEKSGFHCIYINSGHPLGRQFFSAWHECYHAINGQTGVSLMGDLDNDIEEYKAECFAGCILMPEKLVRQYIAVHSINLAFLKYTDIIKMQNFFGVSYSAIIARLIQLFPVHIKVLKQRYALKNLSRAKELEKRTLEAGCSIKLIKPTNDFYVSREFIEDIQSNFRNKRISQEKAGSLINLIESMGTKNGS